MNIKMRRPGLAHFETSVREFSEAVANSRSRAAQMSGFATTPTQTQEHLHAVLEELRCHQEELCVADEELRAQLEELALTSTRANVERDHYRELFDVSPDGYFVTDRVGVIRDANVAATKLVNMGRRFLIGRPLATLVDLADSRALRDAIDQLRTTTSRELTLRLRPRDGEPTWHSIRAAAVEEGTALLWIARDIHAQRTASSAERLPGDSTVTAERFAELERAHRDKDELLARERRFREELTAADAAKERFIELLSHDLRSPLNAVLGWTQLLRRESLDHAARDRALATIERNAQAQLRLLQELLDISRVASNKLQLERLTLDLGDLIRRSVAAVKSVAEDRGIELAVVVDSGTLVVGDRGRLEQVVSNLLSNALKFTDRGGRVVVQLERSGALACVTVEDTGRGIASERLPFVFDPFRAATASGSVSEGLGVGLYVVRRAIEMHGGTVTARSEGLGRGAHFTVHLPIVTSSPAAQMPPEKERKGPSEMNLVGLRVLVVDDDDDGRELVTIVLQQRGAEVTAASDVTTALQAFDAAPVDVVVTDVHMPGRDGLDLVRELRARPRSTVALVAISGFDAPEDVQRALAAGFDVHIAKPIDPTALVAAIGAATRGRR